MLCIGTGGVHWDSVHWDVQYIMWCALGQVGMWCALGAECGVHWEGWICGEHWDVTEYELECNMYCATSKIHASQK